MAQIGIKLADGSFYPILGDVSPGRKRVILAVAEEGQPTVQVDLLRESEEGIRQYVGCLVLEDLAVGAGTELELIVGVDEEAVVNAEIRDSAREQYQSISVHLDSLQQLESFDLPEDESIDIESVDSLEDLGFDDLSVDDVGLPDIQDDFADAGAADEPDTSLEEHFDDDSIETIDDLDGSFAAPLASDDLAFEEEYQEDRDADVEVIREPRSFDPLTVVALVIIVVSLVLLGAYGVFRWLQTEPLPSLRAASLPLVLLTTRRFFTRR